jgi:hypothetical protein
MKNKFNIEINKDKSNIPLNCIHKYNYIVGSTVDITRNIGGFNYFGFRLIKTIK